MNGLSQITCDMIDPDLLKKSVQNIISRVVYHQNVESTNETARELLLKEPIDMTLVISEIQTHGRGRYDRTWVSPLGGLYMSLILRPKFDRDKYPLLNLLAGCVVCQSIRELCRLEAQLKWPNDVIINSKKVAGILSEIINTNQDDSWVIIGIGVNTNSTLSDFPVDLQETVITIRDTLGRDVDINQFIITILQGISQRLSLLETGNHNAILSEWRRMNLTLGSKITIHDNETEITGIAVDITESGSLLVRTSTDNIICVDAGDVIQWTTR